MIHTDLFEQDDMVYAPKPGFQNRFVKATVLARSDDDSLILVESHEYGSDVFEARPADVYYVWPTE